MKHGFLLLVLIAFSCSPKVVHYLNQETDFGALSTYDLVNVKIDKRNLAPQTTELLSIITSRVDYQMNNVRGYVPTKRKPDLILRYELVSSTRTEVNTSRDPFYRFQTVQNETFYESVILLELFHQRKLIWQGSYDLRQNRKSERNRQAIQKAIDLIFTTYPYKAGEKEVQPQLSAKNK